MRGNRGYTRAERHTLTSARESVRRNKGIACLWQRLHPMVAVAHRLARTLARGCSQGVDARCNPGRRRGLRIGVRLHQPERRDCGARVRRFDDALLYRMRRGDRGVLGPRLVQG